ncbi:MAG: shikimate dehydrogenase [Lysobacterales bacterium]
MDHYAVIGHPISHSLSPWIHAQFAIQTQQQLDYASLDITPTELPEFLDKTPLAGLNVTLPHKQAVFQWVDQATDRARVAGATNTVFWDDQGRSIGDNTDGAGLIADLTNRLRLPIENGRVLLLGAGGAARGVAGPLMDQALADLVIVNRTQSRADLLAERVGARAERWEDLARLGPFDGIIHSTAAGHQEMPDLPISLLSERTWCYDLSYGSAAQPFLTWADHNGSVGYDGLGMLVEQAALSFTIWRNIEVATEPVLKRLRQKQLAALAEQP